MACIRPVVKGLGNRCCFRKLMTKTVFLYLQLQILGFTSVARSVMHPSISHSPIPPPPTPPVNQIEAPLCLAQPRKISKKMDHESYFRHLVHHSQ